MNRFYTLILFLCCTLSIAAQTVLFKTDSVRKYPYRIPAIVNTVKGELIAIVDYRPCGADIGYGRVDLVMKTSKDNGKTWSGEQIIIEGTGKGVDAGYGDACLVADRKNNELLMVCASGDIPYQRSTIEHPLRIETLRASYDTVKKQWVWTKPKDHTSEFYNKLFKDTNPSMFMSSGKVCQSSIVKVGKYYRVYAALCTRKGNFVVYSDDFGDTWNVLGNATESCAPQGDEVKCEELPDGSVIISSRKDGGRYFNIFHFKDLKKAIGTWEVEVDSRKAKGGIANAGTPCNGEVLLIPAKEILTGAKTYLLLQSIPAGPGRKNVSVYYKDMGSLVKNKKNRISSMDIASDWNGVYKVSNTNSSYSTMCVQADGKLGFFYEEAPKDLHELTYLPFSVETITAGKYTYRKK
ncbi:MAG: sialidase family protein [Prevotella sp.]